MQKFLFILFFLINFLLIKSQVCTKSKKKASLIFNYYPELPYRRSQWRATVQIVPIKQAAYAYFLTGNKISSNTLRIFNIQCLETPTQIVNCTRDFESN